MPPQTPDGFCNGLPPKTLPCKIMRAAAEGKVSLLEKYLRAPGALADFVTPEGYTPLMAAARLGQAQVVEFLAARLLVNLNQQDADGNTALHHAALSNQTPETTEALLNHKADFSIRNHAGQTAFQCAAHSAHERIYLNQALHSRRFHRQLLRVIHLPDDTDQQITAAMESARQSSARPPIRRTETHPHRESAPAPKKVISNEVTPVTIDTPLLCTIFNGSAPPEQHLVANIAKITPNEFEKAFQKIKQDSQNGGSIIFDPVFIAAAASNNTSAMTYMLAHMSRPMQETLDEALSQTIDAGDHAAAAHILLRLGAEPMAGFTGCLKGKESDLTKPKIYDIAIARLRVECLEDMLIYAEKHPPQERFGLRLALPTFRAISAYFREAHQNNDPAIYASIIPALQSAKALEALNDARARYTRSRKSTLRRAFHNAAQTSQITDIMASYAESRINRLIRGTVDFHQDDMADAIVQAVHHGKFRFACCLIADGATLDPQNKMLLKLQKDKSLSPAAEAFFQDYFSGDMKVLPIMPKHEFWKKLRVESMQKSIPSHYMFHT